MTIEQREKIRAWMAIPENIGALHRTLLATPAVPLDVFDPYGEPSFAGRLAAMSGINERILALCAAFDRTESPEILREIHQLEFEKRGLALDAEREQREA